MNDLGEYKGTQGNWAQVKDQVNAIMASRKFESTSDLGFLEALNPVIRYVYLVYQYSYHYHTNKPLLACVDNVCDALGEDTAEEITAEDDDPVNI